MNSGKTDGNFVAQLNWEITIITISNANYQNRLRIIDMSFSGLETDHHTWQIIHDAEKEISELKAKNKELEETIEQLTNNQSFFAKHNEESNEKILTWIRKYKEQETHFRNEVGEILMDKKELLDALEELYNLSVNQSRQIDSLHFTCNEDLSHLKPFLDVITKYRR